MKYLSIIHFSSLTEKNDIFVLEQFLPAYLSVYNFGGRQQLPITWLMDCFDIHSINQIANDLEWSTLANFFQKLECFHTHSMFQIKDLDVRGCSGAVNSCQLLRSWTVLTCAPLTKSLTIWNGQHLLTFFKS